ncbi:hypothetical protein ACLOJK_024316 [Asimina triloba]
MWSYAEWKHDDATMAAVRLEGKAVAESPLFAYILVRSKQIRDQLFIASICWTTWIVQTLLAVGGISSKMGKMPLPLLGWHGGYRRRSVSVDLDSACRRRHFA